MRSFVSPRATHVAVAGVVLLQSLLASPDACRAAWAPSLTFPFLLRQFPERMEEEFHSMRMSMSILRHIFPGTTVLVSPSIHALDYIGYHRELCLMPPSLSRGDASCLNLGNLDPSWNGLRSMVRHLSCVFGSYADSRALFSLVDLFILPVMLILEFCCRT